MTNAMMSLAQPSIDRLEGIVQSAYELITFAESDPKLAGRAGVEVLALEAKVLIQGGALSGLRRRSLGSKDWASLERLEGILSLAEARMGDCLSSMDAEISGRTVASLSQIIGVTGGAIGIIKSVF